MKQTLTVKIHIIKNIWKYKKKSSQLSQRRVWTLKAWSDFNLDNEVSFTIRFNNPVYFGTKFLRCCSVFGLGTEIHILFDLIFSDYGSEVRLLVLELTANIVTQFHLNCRRHTSLKHLVDVAVVAVIVVWLENFLMYYRGKKLVTIIFVNSYRYAELCFSNFLVPRKVL